MERIAKMTRSTLKKTQVSQSLANFVSVMDRLVETDFEGRYSVLAAKTGIAEPLLSRIRSGRRAPTAKVVGRIARVMEKSAGDQLIGCFLNIIRAEVELNRSSPKVIRKARLFGRFR